MRRVSIAALLPRLLVCSGFGGLFQEKEREMRHLASGLQSASSIDKQKIDVTGDQQWSFRRMTQGRDGGPIAGAPASMELLDWPERFQRAIDKPGQLEWHPNHEEVFVLRGELLFEGGATLRAPSYFNHPPFWLHPTVQHTRGRVRLLRHQSEFPAVGFCAPSAWEGQGCYAPGFPSRCQGVDGLDLDDLRWKESSVIFGEPSGWAVKRIWPTSTTVGALRLCASRPVGARPPTAARPGTARSGLSSTVISRSRVVASAWS